MSSSPVRPGRRLSVAGYLAIVVAYLVVLKAVGLLIGQEPPHDEIPMPDAETVLRNLTIPISVSALFAAAVATWLGWWRDFGRAAQPTPPRSWVRAVPLAMIICALLAIDYGNLSDQSAGLVLALVAAAAAVGFTEELMFRGLGVSTFRRAGFAEGRVALWTSVIFGAVHLSNALTEGSTAILQAIVVSTSGYFFYLGLRTGGVALPMFTHAMWDLSLLSAIAGSSKPTAYAGTLLVILLQVVLIIVLVVRRHAIERPPGEAAPAPTPLFER